MVTDDDLARELRRKLAASHVIIRGLEAERDAALAIARRSADKCEQLREALKSARNLLDSINGRWLMNGVIVNYTRDLYDIDAALAPEEKPE